MRRWWVSAAIILAVIALVGLFALVGSTPKQLPRPDRPGPPGTGPLTIVAMGDSTMSGEGAGNYTPETSGQGGNWCHRSPAASIFQTTVAGIEAEVNLACSGAPSAQVALGDVKQWTEPSQARQLADLTRTHRVAAVVVAVGANDDPHFSQLLTDCFVAWYRADPPCSDEIKAGWQDRVDAMVPKVVGALEDIRTVLERASYQREDYQLVLQSYASPVAPGIPESLRSLNGCPFRVEDLRWVSTRAVATLAAGLSRAADQVDARFLDLSRAGVGHEACSGGTEQHTEWFRRFVVRWADLGDATRFSHAAQESFHPNAAGYAQFGRCLTEFLATTDRDAACLVGDDGNLHAARIPVEP